MEQRGKQKPLGPSGLSALCLQLCELQRAGISPEEAFSILRDDAADSEDRALFAGTAARLEDGDTLSDALAADGRFPPYMIGMVRVGERTGTMEEVLRALSGYFDREANLADSVRSAVVFPLLMGCMMLVLLGVLLAFVLPVFSDAFAALGLTLSPAAAAMLAAGRWVAVAAGVLIVLLALGAVVIWRARKNGKAVFLQRTRTFRDVAASRFASAMSLMLHSGMELDEAVRQAAGLSESEQARDAAQRAADHLAEGATLCDALAGTGLFTAFQLRMLRVGEHAGRTEQMMDEVAARMTMEAATRMDEMIARIEPTIVAVLAVAAGLVLLSVLLPLLGSLSAFG